MNEVTKIHLGRQAFTISIDAHRELKNYLQAIEKQVEDKEVLDEIELRMAELLIERGLDANKVILPGDIDSLKEQLGSPKDFKEDTSDDDEPHIPILKRLESKRLFRDTDNAMIAGVAAGIANYTGLDAVIIRLIFVLLTIFSGGIGIVVYILLWLVVPPAETASEKLQMQGKPVTIEALKDSVSKADVTGAVQRVNNRILPVINGIFRIGLKLIGFGFIISGLGILFGIAIAKIYMLLHDDRLFQENLFPVGAREEWLLALVMGLAAIVAIFLLLTGIATFKRKWPIRGWMTGILFGIFLIGAAASIALAADAAPHVRDRYEATLHTTAVKNIQPFSRVVTTGNIDLAYISSPNYSVNVHYSDHPDLSKLKIHTVNNTLYIDSSELDSTKHCTMLCLFPRYNMTVQIYSPNIEKIMTPPDTEIQYPAPPSFN